MTSVYKEKVATMQSPEELEKVNTDINELLKSNEIFPNVQIPLVETKEVEAFVRNHDLFDMDRILEFSLGFLIF